MAKIEEDIDDDGVKDEGGCTESERILVRM